MSVLPVFHQLSITFELAVMTRMPNIREMNKAEDLRPMLQRLMYYYPVEYRRLIRLLNEDERHLREQQRQQSWHSGRSPYLAQRYGQCASQNIGGYDPWPLRILTTALMLSLGSCVLGVTILTSQQQELPYVLIYLATGAFGLLSTLLTCLLISSSSNR